MSKKLIYIRIIIITICILFISMFVIIINDIRETVNIEENVVEETVEKTKEKKIIFDLTKAPKDQRIKVYNNRKEYLRQLYDSIFVDYKFSNCVELFTYGQLVDNFKSVNSLKKLIIGMKYKNIFNLLFSYDDENIFKELLISFPLNMDDIPVTENYKEKHPKPLFEEFNFIKKEDYETKKKYDKYLDVNTWLALNYEYSIGVNEEEKNVYVMETKNVEFLYEEDGKIRGRVVFDENGEEMTQNSIDTREFVFKYILDEKGYVDDIEFVKETKLADDKYLDHLWENVRG